MMKIDLTKRELKVTADVMLTISAYTYEELQQQFGWTAADVDAWSSAHAKLDMAASS